MNLASGLKLCSLWIYLQCSWTFLFISSRRGITWYAVNNASASLRAYSLNPKAKSSTLPIVMSERRLKIKKDHIDQRGFSFCTWDNPITNTLVPLLFLLPECSTPVLADRRHHTNPVDRPAVDLAELREDSPGWAQTQLWRADNSLTRQLHANVNGYYSDNSYTRREFHIF